MRMKYVSFVFCSLLIYLPHLKGAGNLFAQNILLKLHKRWETNIIAADICLSQKNVFWEEAEVGLKNLGRHCSEYLARAT